MRILVASIMMLTFLGCSNPTPTATPTPVPIPTSLPPPVPDASRIAAATALDGLAAELQDSRPGDAVAYSERLQTYLEANPSFFGAAAALLDGSGNVMASPYVYRTANGYETVDLAVPSYGIERQEWFTAPLAADTGVWTAPYFDEGGGNIWMVTRSVPLRDADGIFAIITTDLPLVPEPTPTSS